jgi:hypothetical protein
MALEIRLFSCRTGTDETDMKYYSTHWTMELFNYTEYSLSSPLYLKVF